jgi:hypothetical protein
MPPNLPGSFAPEPPDQVIALPRQLLEFFTHLACLFFRQKFNAFPCFGYQSFPDLPPT